MAGGGRGVPDDLHHLRFVATPLRAELAGLDHAAYVAGPDVVRVHSDGRWPVAGFTPADDRVLVAHHEVEHRAGRSLAFALLTPSRSAALGCLYVNPLRAFLDRVGAGPQTGAEVSDADAMVTFWLREDQQDTGLARTVVGAIEPWLRGAWPRRRSLFRILPGERSSRVALEASGLERVELSLPCGTPSCLWFERRPRAVDMPAQ